MGTNSQDAAWTYRQRHQELLVGPQALPLRPCLSCSVFVAQRQWGLWLSCSTAVPARFPVLTCTVSAVLLPFELHALHQTHQDGSQQHFASA
jgi:hypothetical protein